VRLQKLLAAAGAGSRRVCENLITEGRVEVDGQIVMELGVRIDPKRQVVHVDGERVNLDEERVYMAFNKPKGVVTTMSDELGRPSIADYLGQREDRLFHVGRLDADTEGLLLLTNDGDLAHRLQHPAYGVLKTYLAQINGPVPRDLGKRLREGVELEDGPVQVDSFRIVDSQPGRALVEVVLHEGRKHVVRRMMEQVGHPVLSLVRTEVGPIRLADLRPGRTRHLGRAEVAALYKAAGL
jgi:23S rRNA pseudouridine2605 synthase